MRGSYTLFILSFIFLAIFSRFIPHPANFTSLNAMALMGTLYFKSCWISFFVVASSMLLTDAVLGYHPMVSFVYLSFALIAFFGKWLKEKSSFLQAASLTVFSSLLFFFLTNFGEWLMGSLYPKTAAGFVTCYIAAIPFFANQLLGDLIYSSVLFLLFKFLRKRSFSGCVINL
ncbi:MAG TPA: hypothetical protein PLC42_04870 [Parachlamydiaceae bacterium]|nr:hypothetical protein [Parachlamydiaceae bacterium]